MAASIPVFWIYRDFIPVGNDQSSVQTRQRDAAAPEVQRENLVAKEIQSEVERGAEQPGAWVTELQFDDDPRLTAENRTRSRRSTLRPELLECALLA
jgi:hypothetical protein